MGNRETGNIARGLAAAPMNTAERTGDPSAPTAPKVNRFAGLFAGYKFLAVPKREGKPFENGAEKGTVQTGLCDILIENLGGIPGVNMPGYRIVKRVSADKKTVKVLCVPPQFSPGGPVKYPYINVKDADQSTKDDYAAILQGMLDGFYVWAKKRKDNGIDLHDGKAVSGGAGTVAEDVDDARIQELGI